MFHYLFDFERNDTKKKKKFFVGKSMHFLLYSEFKMSVALGNISVYIRKRVTFFPQFEFLSVNPEGNLFGRKKSSNRSWEVI